MAPIEQEQKLLDVFRDIRDHIAARLESITFRDLVPGPGKRRGKKGNRSAQ